MMFLFAMWGRPPMTVSANDVQSGGQGFAACGNPGVTGTPGTQVQNGTAPFTYSWQQTGTPAENGPYNISSSSIQNPTWTETQVCDGDSPNSENWRVTVTDSSVPAQQAQATIQVQLTWTNLN